MNKLPRVIYLLPVNRIGGVEIAALSFASIISSRFVVHLRYMAQPNSFLFTPFIVFIGLPLNILVCALRLIFNPPDLLIVSLWRPTLVALLVLIFRRKLNVVLFLHSPRDMHFLDFCVTRVLSYLCTEIWADCNFTIKHRLPTCSCRFSRIISFIPKNIVPLPDKPPSPVFIFWGRLAPIKNLSKTLDLFNLIRACHLNSRLLLIGPFDNDAYVLKTKILHLGLEGCVQLLGPMDFNQISLQALQASFYIQTSLSEGMAMSVVEAMQLGLVPVVTPVGEIPSYCKQNHNAILIDQDILTAAHKVNYLLSNPSSYTLMKESAKLTFKGLPSYKDSISDAIRNCLFRLQMIH